MRNQEEWESAYSSSSFHHKNEYPNIEVVSFIMRNFGKVKDKSKIKILDLGCGWGNNLRFLREKGFDHYGIDFSSAAVDHCRKSFENVLLGEISQLPYATNFFDCVIDRMSIQHNPKEKIRDTFSEVNRVLKPQGLFISFLISKGDYNFLTTYLSKEEIEGLANQFGGGYKIDYMKYSVDNESKVFKVHVLTAKKS